MGTLTKPALETKTLKVKVTTEAVEGERTITAVVSSNAIDRDYERVDVRSLRLPLRGGGEVIARDLNGTESLDIPMLLNHSFDVEDVIGSVRKAYLNESNELVVVFGISGRAKAQDLMQLIDEKHLDNAFSITMNDFEYNESTIYNAEVVEISLVFRGSNKDARVLAVKSLLKESTMAEATEQSLADKKAELEKLQQEIAEAEKTKDEAPKVNPEEEPAKEEAKEVVDPPKQDKETEVPPVEDDTSKSIKKESKNMANDIAVKQVKDAPEVEVVTKKPTLSKKGQRELFVKQFLAYKSGDRETLSELNEKAYEADTAEDKEYKKKAIGFADGAAIFQTEVVSRDILEAYTNVGRLGSMVNHVDILGAETWKRLVQTAGNGFQPVGDQEAKAEDKPVWSNFSVEPKEFALIVAWYDAVARRTPIAVYQQIVRYIAKEFAKLEDKIIISFAGTTTVGGDVFPATGLVPALVSAGRIVNVADFTAANIQAGLGRTFGMIESDEEITLVANRKTWGMLATTVNTQGNNVFTVVGQQVSAGALGTFNVVISQEVPDGNVVAGVMGDYDLVTRGGLETLFSREASVGSLNLFQSDASALRANADIVGKAVRLTSFALIDFVPVVS